MTPSQPPPKSYSGAACSGTSSVNYTNDQGDNGIGRRTGMTDGSGSTAWEYDSRGRVTLEGKTISGQAFNTQWAYNSADLPASMTYPGSEQVSYTYNGQMMLESMGKIF
jgi:YD repeat-containing protein